MRIYEHASELGQWRTMQRSVHPQLRAYVRGYIASTSILPKPVRERHLPALEVPLFLNFGVPHRWLDMTGSRGWVNHVGAWIVGLHDRDQVSEAVGERDYMIVRFTPLGAHYFLGVPMHLLTGRAVELEALDPKLASLIMNRVRTARTWSERFVTMETLIAKRVAQAPVPGGLARAWDELEAADGRIALESLLPEMGCSHRAFIARFRTHIGLTPKTVGRLFRFNHVMRLLDGLSRGRKGGPASKPYIESEVTENQHNPTARWADMAVECGYFDQAHFVKEFRQFAGTTPGEFLRRISNAG